MNRRSLFGAIGGAICGLVFAGRTNAATRDDTIDGVWEERSLTMGPLLDVSDNPKYTPDRVRRHSEWLARKNIGYYAEGGRDVVDVRNFRYAGLVTYHETGESFHRYEYEALIARPSQRLIEFQKAAEAAKWPA